MSYYGKSWKSPGMQAGVLAFIWSPGLHLWSSTSRQSWSLEQRRSADRALTCPPPHRELPGGPARFPEWKPSPRSGNVPKHDRSGKSSIDKQMEQQAATRVTLTLQPVPDRWFQWQCGPPWPDESLWCECSASWSLWCRRPPLEPITDTCSLIGKCVMQPLASWNHLTQYFHTS